MISLEAANAVLRRHSTTILRFGKEKYIDELLFYMRLYSFIFFFLFPFIFFHFLSLFLFLFSFSITLQLDILFSNVDHRTSKRDASCLRQPSLEDRSVFVRSHSYFCSRNENHIHIYIVHRYTRSSSYCTFNDISFMAPMTYGVFLTSVPYDGR